jgi:SAM-dependent methyltransferase
MTPPAPAASPHPPGLHLELYRWAVQDPETHATVLRLMFEHVHRGRTATVLREDFAGTGAESVAWLALGADRRALAVDCDAATVAWARERAARILGPQAARLQVVQADVLDVAPPAVPPADIVSVLNFSILYLRELEALRAYLRHARRCLAAPGLLVMNLFGGPGALRDRTDVHPVIPQPRLPGEAPVPPFEYRWEQRVVDAAARRLDCRIHFRVPDPARPGAVVEHADAFRYDWRLWTLAELTGALRDAGFDRVAVWRHTHDPARGAQGVFLGPVDPAVLAPLELWTAYLVASREAAA